MLIKTLTIDYLLNLLLKEGLLGAGQVEIINKEFNEILSKKRILNSLTRVEKLKINALSSDPLTYLLYLKIPLIGKEGRFIDEMILAQLMSKDSGLDYRRIEQHELNTELVVKALPQSFATRNLIIVLGLIDDETLEVGVRHPFTQNALNDVSRVSGKKTKAVLLTSSNIKRLISEIYAFSTSVRGAENQFDAEAMGAELGSLEQYVKLKSSEEITGDDEHIRNLVDLLFAEAFELKASDIHVEPKKNSLLIRMRLDGVLHDMYNLPHAITTAVTSRIKVMSRLDIAEKRRPQDGRIKFQTKNGEEAEVRVSSIPVAFGEKLVLRILDPEALFLELSDMFQNKDDYKKWLGFCKKPHGIVLMTGPTGSGKTTTLYSTLRAVATSEVNVTTIEDPVEMMHEQFNQISVQPAIGVTFSSIIRHILRQDPDIIMVGEMRDSETANNAVQAALTGHLVLSTLHTNDAPSAIARLVDLGLEPFLISSTMNGIMAQRLLRKICVYCVEEYTLTPEDALKYGYKIKNKMLLKKGRGCIECRNTGYYGRLATVEVLEITDNFKHLILKGNVTAAELKCLARKEGMRTLRENAIDLMLAGITTFDEVLRVTSTD